MKTRWLVEETTEAHGGQWVERRACRSEAAAHKFAAEHIAYFRRRRMCNPAGWDVRVREVRDLPW